MTGLSAKLLKCVKACSYFIFAVKTRGILQCKTFYNIKFLTSLRTPIRLILRRSRLIPLKSISRQNNKNKDISLKKKQYEDQINIHES